MTAIILHKTSARARVCALTPYWRRERMKIERILESKDDRCERGKSTRKEAAQG